MWRFDFNAPGTDDSSSVWDWMTCSRRLIWNSVRSPGWNDPGHLLDLINTDQPSNIQDVRVIDSGLVSDHQFILCFSRHHLVKFVAASSSIYLGTVKIKNINPNPGFVIHHLFSSPAMNANSFADQIEPVITAMIDEVAPLKTHSRCHRRQSPDGSQRMQSLQATSSKLESKMAAHEIRLWSTGISSSLSTREQAHQHISAGIFLRTFIRHGLQAWCIDGKLQNRCFIPSNIHEKSTDELKQPMNWNKRVQSFRFLLVK